MAAVTQVRILVTACLSIFYMQMHSIKQALHYTELHNFPTGTVSKIYFHFQQEYDTGLAFPQKIRSTFKTFSSASAGNRTRINCLEGSYADHYTTDATVPASDHFDWAMQIITGANGTQTHIYHPREVSHCRGH